MTIGKKMPDAILVSRELQDIARELDARLDQLCGHKVGFALHIFTADRAQYVSNCERAEVVEAMTKLLGYWKQGMPDVPAHEVRS